MRELNAKGGRKSGETRRAKANIKKALATIASCNVPEGKTKDFLKSMGIEPTMENAMAFAIIQKAAKGDTKAFNAYVKYSGQDEVDKAKIAESKERTKLVKAQREEIEMHDEPEQFEDDGFIEALKGTAASDWADYKDDGEDDTED